MRARRRTRWLLSPLLLLFLALGTVAGWQIEAALGPATPTASGATGACAPALSTLVTNHLSVPRGVAATVTATCENASGPVEGRTIVLKQSGGNSTITPTAAVTDAHGVAVFEVKSLSVAGPITYTAVDEASGGTFDQIVQIRFVSAVTSVVPMGTIGVLGVAALSALLLAFLQVWRRRRRAPASAQVRHVS